MHKQAIVPHEKEVKDLVPYQRKHSDSESERRIIKRKREISDSDEFESKRYRHTSENDLAIAPYVKAEKVKGKLKNKSRKRAREDSDSEELEFKRYRAEPRELDYTNDLAVIPYVKTRRKKMKRKFIQPKSDSESELMENYRDEIVSERGKFEGILKLKNEEINKIKIECDEKIKVLQNESRDAQEKSKVELNDHMNNYTKIMSEMEQHYEAQINLLKEKLKSLDGNEESFKPLSDAIFNCVTIEEIFKIKKLIHNREFDELVSSHLDTLQKMFLSLSYGVIPICQPQRDIMTESQKKLIQKIETASPSKAKNLIMRNRSDIINIFDVIDQSLELATVTYDRFRRL